MTTLILITTAILLFIVYNIVALNKFGIPNSLSETFYLWNGVKKHLGYVFTGMMGGMTFTLLPAWLEIGNTISSWSQYLNCLIFLACGAIMFVGVAPAFRKDEMESTVHCTAAKAAAACSLVWCFSACW